MFIMGAAAAVGPSPILILMSVVDALIHVVKESRNTNKKLTDVSSLGRVSLVVTSTCAVERSTMTTHPSPSKETCLLYISFAQLVTFQTQLVRRT